MPEEKLQIPNGTKTMFLWVQVLALGAKGSLLQTHFPLKSPFFLVGCSIFCQSLVMRSAYFGLSYCLTIMAVH